LKSPSVRSLEVQPENLIVTEGFTGTWQSLRRELVYTRLSSLAAESDKFGLVVDSNLQAAAALLLLADRPDLDVLITPRSKFTEAVAAKISDAGFNIHNLEGEVICAGATPSRTIEGSITLLTSGSTGVPKLVRHSLDTLFTARRVRKDKCRRWLVPYQTATYAWYQLVTQGMFGTDQHLVFSNEEDLHGIFDQAAGQRVDSISATPTFWRLAFLQLPNNVLRSLPLKLITLGGELVDQSILDQLSTMYPSADIVHIYASTEAGVCVVVKDKKAGFPASILQRRDPELPSVRIKNGQLQIQSPYSGTACDEAESGVDSWINTGDLVETRDDRIYFCGRADRALINVGGSKAFPADIEAAIQKHPAVAWCRVRAVRAPLVGNLPEADLVLKFGYETVTERELNKFCAVCLPEYAVPRFWNFLPSIPITGNLKAEL
jgi:acyl-coenzyme A synthetase/AMP-(fatty) acid ligase